MTFSGVFIVNIKQISQIFLVLPLLNLKKINASWENNLECLYCWLGISIASNVTCSALVVWNIERENFFVVHNIHDYSSLLIFYRSHNYWTQKPFTWKIKNYSHEKKVEDISGQPFVQVFWRGFWTNGFLLTSGIFSLNWPRIKY